MDKLDLIIGKIDDHKENIDRRLDSIDKNLYEHMRRTDVLEKLHKDNQDRIALLEEPRKALKLLKSMLLYSAAISGSIITIIKVIEYFQ